MVWQNIFIKKCKLRNFQNAKKCKLHNFYIDQRIKVGSINSFLTILGFASSRLLCRTRECSGLHDRVINSKMPKEIQKRRKVYLNPFLIFFYGNVEFIEPTLIKGYNKGVANGHAFAVYHSASPAVVRVNAMLRCLCISLPP